MSTPHRTSSFTSPGGSASVEDDDSRHGLIGSGRIDGRKWSLVAQKPGAGGVGKNTECFLASGAVSKEQGCLQLAQLSATTGQVIRLGG